MKSLLMAAALFALAAPCAAQTAVTGIGWEVAKLEGKKRAPYAPLAELRADPYSKFSDRLRAVISLRNSGAKKAEGLVLRYALRLRLHKTGDPAEKAFWGAPYYSEELRVAAVGAGAERAARANNFWLGEQLARLRNTGFTATALKIEVMLYPRSGDEPAGLTREAVLEMRKP
jgi:hypothetical protein